MNETKSGDRTRFEETVLSVLLEALHEKQADGTLTSGSPRPGSRKRLLPVLVAAIAAALVGGWMLSSAVADRTVEVSAAEAVRNPEQVERALREVGIEAEVRVVPVDRHLAGKWFHLYIPPGAPVDQRTFANLKSQVGHILPGADALASGCENGCERTATLEVPLELPARLTLIAGRAAGPAEEYWSRHMSWTNELAPSGALYCYRLEERTPARARTVLERLGYRVSWSYNDVSIDHPGPGGRNQVAHPPSGTQVVEAWSPAPGEVTVVVVPDEHAESWKVSVGTPSESHSRPSAPWAPTC